MTADGAMGVEGPILEGDASKVTDELADLDDPSPVRDHHSVRYSLAWWLSFVVPISIALVAIMGAVVGYCVEYHASLSSTFDDDAQVSATYLSGHDSDALLTAQAAETDHDLWEQLAGATGTGTGQAVVDASEPACANFDGGAPASVTAATATVDCQLAQVFSSFAFAGYWVHGDPTAFDTERFVGDWVALGNLGRDVAVNQYTSMANDQRDREKRLLWLAMFLALALAFCTLAQAAVHHRWSRRPTRTSLLLAVPGWILLVVSSVVLLVWEL